MCPALPRTCLYSLCWALLVAPATALANVNAWVYQNGPAFIIDHGTNVAGHAAAELAGGASVGAGSYAYVGSAYADSRSGSLGGAVTATGSGYDTSNDRLTVLAHASFGELLTFSATGPVSFRLAVQGSFDVDAGGEARSFASFAIIGQSPSTAYAFARGLSSFSTSNVTHATVISATRSNYIVWLERTVFAFAGVPVPIEAELEVFGTPPVTGSSQALFGHTARLAIFTPWLWLLGVLLLAGITRRGCLPPVSDRIEAGKHGPSHRKPTPCARLL
jgi:hypothetical protein